MTHTKKSLIEEFGCSRGTLTNIFHELSPFAVGPSRIGPQAYWIARMALGIRRTIRGSQAHTASFLKPLKENIGMTYKTARNLANSKADVKKILITENGVQILLSEGQLHEAIAEHDLVEVVKL